MKQLKTNRGFTIVELLIVIVVIAILAAISIVAYNGIQNRARNTSAEGAANQLVKKAEAYNSVKGVYPTDATQFAATDAKEAGLEGMDVIYGATALDATKPGRVKYTPCPATGTKTGGRATYNTYPTGTANKDVGVGC